MRNNIDRYSKIIDVVPGAAYYKDREGIYIACNQNFLSMLGFTSFSQIIGYSDDKLPWNRYANEIRINDNKIIKSVIENSFEEKLIKTNGEEILIKINKKPVLDTNNAVCGIIANLVDITNYKKLQKAKPAKKFIQTDQEQVQIFLDNILANLPGRVYWKDKNGVYLGCNNQLIHDCHFESTKDIIGKTDYDLPSKSQADILRSIDKEVMRTGIPQTIEEPGTRFDGTAAIYFTSKVPLKDLKGNIIGILGISFDITSEKEAEILKTQNQILEKQVKLFKHVSATVAHELSTPLRAIEMGTSVIKDYLPTLIQAYKNHVSESSNKITSQELIELESCPNLIITEVNSSFLFIKMLLASIRMEKLSNNMNEPLSMTDVLEESISRYPFKGDQKEKINLDIAQNFVFSGNKELFEHIIFNLLKNALYYIAKAQKGQISIWTDLKQDVNELHFKDTGTGIPQDILSKIFEQFYSNTLHGSGVGLTYCKMVMESFGGDITCQSVDGEYTEFILTFPKLAITR